MERRESRTPENLPRNLSKLRTGLDVARLVILALFIILMMIATLAADSFKYRPEIVTGIARIQVYRVYDGVSLETSNGAIYRLKCLSDRDYGCWQVHPREGIAVAKSCVRGIQREGCWPRSTTVRLGEPASALLLKRGPRLFGEPLLLALRSEEGVLIPIEDGAKRLKLTCKNLESPLPAGDWGNMGSLAHCP